MSVTNRKPGSELIAKATSTAVRRAALNLLARREHSVLELHHKLRRRGFLPELIGPVLAQLVAENLLNETRYAEVYAYGRVDKGYGPLRIGQELRERGVAEPIVATILADLDDHWMKKLAAVRRKRFGAELPKDAAGQAQQLRFLRHRGFTVEQIKRLFRES